MNLPKVITTPVGASSSVAGLVSLIANVVLPPLWPWWSRQDQSWRGAASTVLIFVLSYLGAWLKVVRTPGQKATITLTPSRLPTVQAARESAKV